MKAHKNAKPKMVNMVTIVPVKAQDVSIVTVIPNISSQRRWCGC